MSMQAPLNQQEHPEQQTADELVTRIRKLRWLGMEREAETLAEELARRQTREMAAVIAQARARPIDRSSK
jgi:ABC-type hemin transport system substrate-binding protein